MKQAQAKRMSEGRHNFCKGHKLFGKNIGDIMRGKPSPRKGAKHTESAKKKMSVALKGRKLSAEHIEKLRQYKTGKIGYWAGKSRPMSEETKNRIGTANRKIIHKTDESKIWRRRTEYKKWRESVYKRDEYTCQECGKKGGILNPHHIKEFSKYKELRFDINNGITLCIKCHKKIHRKN